MITLATKYAQKKEVLADFSLFGLEDKQQEEYPGAEIFGAQFKKCSILRDVPTYYSNSSVNKKE